MGSCFSRPSKSFPGKGHSLHSSDVQAEHADQPPPQQSRQQKKQQRQPSSGINSHKGGRALGSGARESARQKQPSSDAGSPAGGRTLGGDTNKDEPAASMAAQAAIARMKINEQSKSMTPEFLRRNKR